jgi:hypothetical protein
MAQDTSPKAPQPDQTHFRLVYRLLQLGEDGKIANARSYSTIVTADDPHPRDSKIRVTDNVPIQLGNGWDHRRIGTGIDVSQAKLRGRQLSLHVSASYDSIPKSLTIQNFQAPVDREVKWESDVVVTVDKPTIIFATDNVSDAGKTELELTATEIKQP